jgi:hypothetical protein
MKPARNLWIGFLCQFEHFSSKCGSSSIIDFVWPPKNVTERCRKEAIPDRKRWKEYDVELIETTGIVFCVLCIKTKPTHDQH